ncbi:hypothetical protein [Sphingomonas sp. Leaf4]|uniref:hypothetical protein n=1 Tax=Sphingomonas sp. Leaf4 TaxID=2876553 RepID=UPI001E384CA6|nr:hypothetical protein [Sphingomonas sp. Leaf4]
MAGRTMAWMAAVAMAGQASAAMAAPGVTAGVATNRTALAIPAEPQSAPTGQCRAADGTPVSCDEAGAMRGGYLGRSWPVLLGAIAAASLGIVAAVSSKSGAPASP